MLQLHLVERLPASMSMLQNRTRSTVVVQDAIIKPFCAGVNNFMAVVYSDEVCSV